SFPTLKLTTTKKTPTIKVKPTRSPGDSYDSEDPEREDDPLIEEGIILRMLPDESLDYLQRCVQDGDLSGISIKWKDKKRAIVRVNGLMYGGKLIELPTITEVHKSIDKKNIFKTIDICQMLLVVKKLENERDINDIEVDMDVGESHPDGLTPPMENCKERFKKRYQSKVLQSVEDRVNELLKLDEEAETSAYEFIDPEAVDHASNYPTPGSFAISSQKKSKKKNLDLDNELDRLMGADDDQDEMGKEFDAAFDDDNEEEEAEEIIEGAPEDGDDNNDSSDDDDDDDDDEEEDDQEGADRLRASVNENYEVDEVEQHNAILREEISELDATIQQKLKDLSKANNPIMKNRINDVVTRLKQELEIKKKQIKEVETTTTDANKDDDDAPRLDEGNYDDDEGLGLDEDEDDDEEMED
ncbi:hypothetical protein CANARDRAFT_184734, partial [[Candida] arabinofermentans NRRL YB-2248]